MQPGYPPPGQDPYGQQPGQDPYGQQPQQPYQDPYAQPQYGQPQYGQPPQQYSQPQQYQDPYAQPQQPAYQDPYAQPQPISANPYPTSGGNPYPTSPGYPTYPASPAGYPQPGYPQGPNPNATSPLAIVSLVLGILSIPLGCCYYIGLLPGIAAVVLGFLGMKKANEGQAGGKGMAIAGLVCGAVGVALALLLVVLTILAISIPGTTTY